MSVLNEANVRHLLRRTEFVDRSPRVAELLQLGSMEEVVDDVLNVGGGLSTVSFLPEDDNATRLTHLTNFWIDQMVTSERPLRERMALFWHGHFCSGMQKVVTTSAMQEQVDLFRSSGLGEVSTLAKTMSMQVAMIRYLDNNRNHKSSPNQNFGRELLELFLLGVGNYTEADVEAATAAWTGHGEDLNNPASPYIWRPEWHDFSAKSFMGSAINLGSDGALHGPEVIDVILNNGIVSAEAMNASNHGRPSQLVAAEFLSIKLWSHFAGTIPSTDVITVLRDVLVEHQFEITPWVRTMLLHDEFYTDEVKSGLVRSPVELVVAYLSAIGKPAAEAAPGQFTMANMGQRLFYPPDVSGWKTNGYWVNAAYMSQRAVAAQYVFNKATVGYYSQPDGAVSLAGGVILRTSVTELVDGVRVLSDTDFVDQLIALGDLRVSAATRARAISLSAESAVTERVDALLLLLLAPDLQLA